MLDDATVSVWENPAVSAHPTRKAQKSVRFAMRNRDAGGQNTYYLSYNKGNDTSSW